MRIRMTTCDVTPIDRMLAGDLTAAEQSALELHLESCVACRGELEMRAAAPPLWREARDHLGSSRHRVFAATTNRDEPLKMGVELVGKESLGQGPICPSDVGDTCHVNSPLELAEERAAATEIVLRTLAPSDDPAMLGRIGAYEVQGVVGCGGMGVVLKCFDRTLQRIVAVKVLSPHLATSGSARQRFAREAQAAAAVVHENVVAIHCVADSADLPYFVMPYLRSGSLQKRIDQQGSLKTREVLRIGLQVARGLDAAHRQGLVHRDIKPANVLVGEGVERVLITDFGLARAIDDAAMTRTGFIAGTPLYMSPEQARGEAVDHRSDLFSLGSLMYALCTGRPPFRAETTLAILRRICDTEPRPIREVNPEVPEWLCQLIRRLHQKDPTRRWESASQVADLLEKCLSHLQEPSGQEVPVELRGGWRAWGRWGAMLVHLPHDEPAEAGGWRKRQTLAEMTAALALGVSFVYFLAGGVAWRFERNGDVADWGRQLDKELQTMGKELDEFISQNDYATISITSEIDDAKSRL